MYHIMVNTWQNVSLIYMSQLRQNITNTVRWIIQRTLGQQEKDILNNSETCYVHTLFAMAKRNILPCFGK